MILNAIAENLKRSQRTTSKSQAFRGLEEMFRERGFEVGLKHRLRRFDARRR